ncbi:hypothetical protein EMIT0232MI5_10224 [Pseudomonas sp. IT-232MI5]
MRTVNSSSNTKNKPYTEHNVGVSLLAIADCQLQIGRLTHRYREQAHSYRFCGALTNSIFM